MSSFPHAGRGRGVCICCPNTLHVVELLSTDPTLYLHCVQLLNACSHISGKGMMQYSTARYSHAVECFREPDHCKSSICSALCVLLLILSMCESHIQHDYDLHALRMSSGMQRATLPRHRVRSPRHRVIPARRKGWDAGQQIRPK